MFSISAIFKGRERSSKLGQKCELLVLLFSMKTWILQRNFQTVFFSATVLPLVTISAKLNHIWESKGPKTSQKGYFMDAELVDKTLKIFNSTTTNAILMKITTIMYSHESVKQKPLRARNSVFWLNIQEFSEVIKNRHICYVLPCIASLLTFLYILNHIWGSVSSMFCSSLGQLF